MQIFTPQGDFYFSAFALLLSVALGWACGYMQRKLRNGEDMTRQKLYYESLLRKKDRHISELSAACLGFEDFDSLGAQEEEKEDMEDGQGNDDEA